MFNSMHVHILCIVNIYGPALTCFGMHVIVLCALSYIMYIAQRLYNRVHRELQPSAILGGYLINFLQQLQSLTKSSTTSFTTRVSHYPLKLFVLYYTRAPSLTTLNPSHFPG